jgi:hypothetical protein
MTDNSDSDLEVERPGLNADGQEPGPATPIRSELRHGPAEPPATKVPVASLKLSKLCARELTDEEKAKRDRRLKEIRAGRHPDTGQRLKPGDRKTLKPREIFELQRYLDAKLMRYGAPYLSDFNRSMLEAQEHRRAIGTSICSTPIPDYLDLAMHAYQQQLSVPPSPDNPLVGDQFREHYLRQPSMDASFHNTANDLACDRVAQIDHRRRFLDPLLDPDFVRRITVGVSSDLLRNVTEQRDAFALRTLQEKVESAATMRMIEHWTIAAGGPWSSILAKEAAAGFGQDRNIMAREAERMLSIYGPSIAEQNHFLTEYHSNLGLFQSSGLRAGAFEGADLLARIALPTDLLPGFDEYQSVRIERLQAYARAQLSELEDDFEREPNPVFVWEAFRLAQSYGAELPDWVVDHIGDVADTIHDICEEDQAGRKLTEAELVGKALGFSQGGRGQTGWFAHAKQVQRDKDIYFRVEEWMSEQKLQNPTRRPKLSSAYAEVAAELGLDASTIGRAYRRIKSYIRGDDEIES